jgi:hypothetical protein
MPKKKLSQTHKPYQTLATQFQQVGQRQTLDVMVLRLQDKLRKRKEAKNLTKNGN